MSSLQNENQEQEKKEEIVTTLENPEEKKSDEQSNSNQNFNQILQMKLNKKPEQRPPVMSKKPENENSHPVLRNEQKLPTLLSIIQPKNINEQKMEQKNQEKVEEKVVEKIEDKKEEIIDFKNEEFNNVFFSIKIYTMEFNQKNNNPQPFEQSPQFRETFFGNKK